MTRSLLFVQRALLVLGIVAAMTAPSLAQNVTVPNVVGKNAYTATKELHAAGLNADDRHSTAVPPNDPRADKVYQTRPEAGKSVPKGSVIEVYWRQGVGQVIPPKGSQETVQQAVERAEKAEKAAKAAIAQKNKEMTDRADAQRRTAELARAKSEENRLRIQAEGRAKVAAEQAAKEAAAKAAIAQKNKEMTDRADAQRRTAELARAKSEEKRREQVKWGACTANGFTNCGPKPKP